MKHVRETRGAGLAGPIPTGWRSQATVLLIACLLSACTPASAMRGATAPGGAVTPGAGGWHAVSGLPDKITDKITVERGSEWVEWSLSEDGSTLRLRTDGRAHVGPVPWQSHRQALENLLGARENRGARPVRLQTGPIQRLDGGRWAAVICAESTAGPAGRNRGSLTSFNEAYLATVRRTGADRELADLFASIGYQLELASVEKVFLRAGGIEAGQPCAYDAGSHYFRIDQTEGESAR